ncbi:hypothetical protein BGX26_007231 [Mortierella sp. AD094]|nr:hypothetical protein BGX26_007231 [Mortierella sp. AD094]
MDQNQAMAAVDENSLKEKQENVELTSGQTLIKKVQFDNNTQIIGQHQDDASDYMISDDDQNSDSSASPGQRRHHYQPEGDQSVVESIPGVIHTQQLQESAYPVLQSKAVDVINNIAQYDSNGFMADRTGAPFPLQVNPAVDLVKSHEPFGPMPPNTTSPNDSALPGAIGDVDSLSFPSSFEKPTIYTAPSPKIARTSSDPLPTSDCTSPRSLESAMARMQLLHWSQAVMRLRDQEKLLTGRIDQLVEELASVLEKCQDTEMGLMATDSTVQELRQELVKEQEIGFASIQEAALSIQEKQVLEQSLKETWKELDTLRAAWVERQEQKQKKDQSVQTLVKALATPSYTTVSSLKSKKRSVKDSSTLTN